MTSYSCPNCDRVFTQKDNLEYHISKNACKQYTHFCKFCEKGFTTETSMYRHIRTACNVKFNKDNEIHKELNNIKLDVEKIKKLTRVLKKITN